MTIREAIAKYDRLAEKNEGSDAAGDFAQIAYWLGELEGRRMLESWRVEQHGSPEITRKEDGSYGYRRDGG